MSQFASYIVRVACTLVLMTNQLMSQFALYTVRVASNLVCLASNKVNLVFKSVNKAPMNQSASLIILKVFKLLI